jgi:hypothetical protein
MLGGLNATVQTEIISFKKGVYASVPLLFRPEANDDPKNKTGVGISRN